MRRLNLVRGFRAPSEAASAGRMREVVFGGERVFLDTGTLEAFAAESDGEGTPESSGLGPSFPPPGPSRTAPSAICLSVTHACNLACRYCYVRANARSRAAMSLETARRAIELLRPPGPWRVGFFGGEPMLAWDLVREVTELARERAQREGAKLRFSLTTNGTLVTPERAEFMAQRGFSVITSLDGPRELHDSERAMPDGAGSFVRTMEGLRVLSAAGIGGRVTLRATFPLARPELVRRLEFLNSLAYEGLARAVSVEPAWPAPGEPAPLEAVEEEYLGAARWAAERIESGKRVLFHHLEKALERVLLMRPAGTECGAGFGYVEIAPSGEIHACHKAVGGAIGDVDAGISERLRARWLENRWYARLACRECWARNVCGGGCRAVALEHTGSLGRTWPVACALKKAQVRAALYVAVKCSRERLTRFLRTRAARPGRRVPRRPDGRRVKTDVFHTARRGAESEDRRIPHGDAGVLAAVAEGFDRVHRGGVGSA